MTALAMAFAADAAGQAQTAAAAADAWRLVPADAQAAVVVPHLKRASDHLTRLLEGMDRAGLLVGSRPIDHFKSITGYATAVDDNGAAALIVLDSRPGAQRVAWLVPVTDADEFLAANFAAVSEQPEALRSADGRIVFARSLQGHVLLSADAAAIAELDFADNLAGPMARMLGEGGVPGFADADALIVLRGPMLASLRQRALKPAADMELVLPAPAMLAINASEQIDAIALTIQCDPLALIVRGAMIFQEDSAIGASAIAQPPDDAGLARLPRRPAALALTVNFAALGGEKMIHDLASEHGVDERLIPTWLPMCRSMQLHIAPSAAGAAGGLLNGAVATIAGANPQRMRDAIKRDVFAGAETQPPTRAAKWQDARALADGTTAAAYEVRAIDGPPQLAMIETLLFGSAGARGFVGVTDDAAIITFAQRPALLTEAAAAARAAALPDAPAGGFAALPAVRIMRQWMPARRDVEGYLGTGQIVEWIKPFAAGLPGANAALPEFDASLPPIGFAMDLSPRRIDGALIMPAGVLASMLDDAMRRRTAPTE